MDFFRFPHTPHIAWLGQDVPRDDKVLSTAEADELLKGRVQVEEKLDGANIGISLHPDGTLRIQNRGQYLTEPFSGQFSRLASWLSQQQWTLQEKLPSTLILFGEWCAARHSLDYPDLPDWFVLFDVYDREQQQFWSSARRKVLADALDLTEVATVFNGTTSLPLLKQLLQNTASRYRPGPPEGFVIRKESADWCLLRAKLVRREFTQTISDHWRSQIIEWNKLAPNKQ